MACTSKTEADGREKYDHKQAKVQTIEPSRSPFVVGCHRGPSPLRVSTRVPLYAVAGQAMTNEPAAGAGRLVSIAQYWQWKIACCPRETRVIAWTLRRSLTT